MDKCSDDCQVACDFCIHFQRKENTCFVLECDTTPGDWCDLFHCRNAFEAEV